MKLSIGSQQPPASWKFQSKITSCLLRTPAGESSFGKVGTKQTGKGIQTVVPIMISRNSENVWMLRGVCSVKSSFKGSHEPSAIVIPACGWIDFIASED